MMSKRAAVIWLLDDLGAIGVKESLADASLVAKQIRAIGAKLLVEFFKQQVEFARDGLFAFSRNELHWLVADSVNQFGFQLGLQQKIEGVIWSRLVNFYGGYYNLPEIIVVISPSRESEHWVRKLMGYGREVWVVKSPDVNLGKIEFQARVVEMSALRKVEKPPPRQFQSNALVFWDIENFVPVHYSTGNIAVEQAEILMDAIGKFFDKHNMSIDQDQSIVCLKKRCSIEKELAKIVAVHGIKVITAPKFHEPAEQRIVSRVMALDRKINFSPRQVNVPDIVVIFSGDRHVIPAVYALKEKKIPVWVIAWWDSSNKGLRDCADKFIPLESLLGMVNVKCVQKRMMTAV